jgi:hypothetical protein
MSPRGLAGGAGPEALGGHGLDHRLAVHGFAGVGQDLNRRLELTQLLGRLGGGRRHLGGRLLSRHRSVLSHRVLRSRVATTATQQDSQLPRGRKKLKRNRQKISAVLPAPGTSLDGRDPAIPRCWFRGVRMKGDPRDS